MPSHLDAPITKARTTMRNVRQRTVGLLMTALAVSLWGCGGAPAEDTSTEEVTVSGKVTFKGKPVPKGEVRFSPGNSSRPSPPRKSAISKDGSYSVKTLVGVNDVEVFAPIIQKAGPDVRPFSHDVKSGDNTFDIELPRTQ
jgi:hypothetical protein